MNYLENIAISLLAISPNKLTKVRFAKYIYIAHKYLVTKRLAQISDLRFIRMPLGPVACGFFQITDNNKILVNNITKPTLQYNAVEYYANRTKIPNELPYELEVLVKGLERYSTSAIVEHTHADLSWKNHKNGDEYFIQEEDLQNNILNEKPITYSSNVDTQKIQGLLVEGMIDEMALANTALEYPEIIGK